MMDLEDAGLIYSPHTSAGRVPTEAGLRFFVDALLEVGSISPDERARIDAQMAGSQPPAPDRGGAGRGDHAAVRPVALRRRRGGAQDQCAAEAHRIREPRARAAALSFWSARTAPSRTALSTCPPDCRLGTVTGLELSLGAHAGQDDRRSAALRAARRSGHSRRELDELSARVVEAGVATWSGSPTTTTAC